MPTEEKCRAKDCPFFTVWCGPYGSAGAPACKHPESGPRTVNLLDEIERCPEDGR